MEPPALAMSRVVRVQIGRPAAVNTDGNVRGGRVTSAPPPLASACPSPIREGPRPPVDFPVDSTGGSRMLTALMVLLRSFRLICGGHGATVLENQALPQQLAVLTRTVKRPQVRSTDRLFWPLLAKGWRDWRSALVIVRPDTVVRWHRQWLRRHWTRLSQRRRPGRPSTNSTNSRARQHDDHRESVVGSAADLRRIGKLGITV